MTEQCIVTEKKLIPFYVVDFIFSFKFIYILNYVLEFTSD